MTNKRKHREILKKRNRRIRGKDNGQEIPDDIKKLLKELEQAAEATKVSDPNDANLKVQKTVVVAEKVIAAVASQPGLVCKGKIAGAVDKQVESAKTHARKKSAGVKTPSVKRNPGPAFEKWVEINWETIVTNSSHCITAPEKLSDTENCSKDWFDLKSTPPFTRKTGANPANGTPFGKCDFTNIPATTPPTPPVPTPRPNFFIECKAKGGASSINLSARCYALLEAAIAGPAKHEPWVIICRDYQWNPPTPPAGTTTTEFQPNHVIIIGPGVLNALIPPPGTLPSSPSRPACCPIINGTTPPVSFTNIDHPVGGTPSASLTGKTHATKVEIYA